MNQTDNNHQRISPSGVFNRLRKQIIFFFVAVNFLSAFIVLSGISPLTNQVAAWCEPDADPIGIPVFSGDTFTEECKLENLEAIEKLPPDRVISESQYDTKIEACRNGNAGGWDLGLGEFSISAEEQKARCANAIVSCQTYAINTEDCTPDNLKTIAGSECNSGRLSGTGNDDCQRLKEMNGTHVDKIAADACIGEPGDNAASGKITNDCKNAVSSKCVGNNILNDDGSVRGNALEDARKCAQEESRKQAQSPEACATRGGIYVDQEYKDPNVAGGGNVIGPGCKNDIREAANPAACAAVSGQADGGTKWVKVGEPNHWECQFNDPEKNGEGDEEEDADADCPRDPDTNECASIERADEHCGDARVNLLGCGEDQKGAEAFTAILRIILRVLTVLVGVAAVGGLAYAAITYARAEDDSGKTSEAKTLIRNIVIGILLYGFLIVIASWLIPGGVMGSSSGGWF